MLAACGVGDPAEEEPANGDAETNTPGETASGDVEGEIRAAWWGGDSENESINAVLDAFTDETGVDVLREAQPWDGYWDRLATQTAGGNAPDLIMQAGSQIPDYASRGTLLDLTAVDELDAGAIDEGLQQFGAVGDELYGVVAAANAMGLVANEDLLIEAGVSLPEGEYTWDDLADVANSASDALGDDVWGIHDAGGDLIMFILMVRDDGRQFYNDDGSVNATPEDLSTWFEYWDDLREAGGAPPADVTAEGQGVLPNSPLAQERSAMAFGWTQDYVAYTRVLDADLSLSLPPYNTANPSLWMNAASLWSVSAETENVGAAVEAINYMTNSEDAIGTLGVSLGLPPTQEARAQLAGTLTSSEDAAMEYMDVVAETSTPLNRLWPGGFAELRSLMSDLNEAVAFGSTSIPDAVDEFFDRAAGLE